MKKIIAAVLVAVMAVSLFGCADTGEKKSTKKDKDTKQTQIDIGELKENDGDLLVITSTPQVAMSEEDFDNAIFTWKVSYSGYAYCPNPVEETGVKMSDKDLLFIYEFCIDAYENDTFKDYSEEVCDGDTYSFTYYDTDGKMHVLYSGYCYDNEDLQEVMEVIGKYQVD